MSVIFVGQGLMSIKLDCGIDTSQATVRRILYKKPSGVVGYYSAETDTNVTVLKFDLPDNTILNEEGVWKFQSFLTIGGRDAYGEVVEQEIKKTLS